MVRLGHLKSYKILIVGKRQMIQLDGIFINYFSEFQLFLHILGYIAFQMAATLPNGQATILKR